MGFNSKVGNRRKAYLVGIILKSLAPGFRRSVAKNSLGILSLYALWLCLSFLRAVEAGLWLASGHQVITGFLLFSFYLKSGCVVDIPLALHAG